MHRKEAKILRKGGFGVFPTDTAYALGCKFNSKNGIKKILEWKNRKDDKFVLVASSLNQAKRYFKISKKQENYIKKHWPGPVSLVVNKKFAVRVPKNEIARSLARGAGCPLVATSLNISGQPAAYDLKKINKTEFDFVIDIGKLRHRKTSKIIKVENNKIIIIRA